jgi:hypothetical protein
MIKSVVYFHGPLTAWQGTPAESEIIARFESRWRFIAHAHALAALKRLNSGRCGLLMTDANGQTLEHLPATVTVIDPR